jgi:CRISPR-associated protein Cas2
MLVICLYDITCDKRRRKVNKILEGYGVRSQYSVYECQITEKQLRTIQKSIKKTITDNDVVNYYPLCGKDIALRRADGYAQVNWPSSHYIA